MSSKLLSILLLLFVPFPMHGIVQYDYKAFFLPYTFGHLYAWTFTISKIVTQASLVKNLVQNVYSVVIPTGMLVPLLAFIMINAAH